MANMEITFKEAEAKKEELKASTLKIVDLIAKQDRLLGSLVDESIWKGPTRNAVLEKKNEIRNQTKDLKDMFNNYILYLQNVVNDYQSLDNYLIEEQDLRLNK